MADGLTAPRIQYQSKAYDMFIDPDNTTNTFTGEVWKSGSLMRRETGFQHEYQAKEWFWMVVTCDIEDDCDSTLFPTPLPEK